LGENTAAINPSARANATAMKTLDSKLKTIAQGRYSAKHFILADAKDPDHAFGVPSFGPDPGGGYRSTLTFRRSIAEMVKQKQMDVMLCSLSNLEALTGHFAKSGVTPAIRANDTTDIWLARGSSYSKEPSRPFRTANLAYAKKVCDLGLYSVTFNNALERDYATLEAYSRFREDAVKHKFRHFLEVFNPNAPQGLSPEQVPAFVNDNICRLLAAQSKAERPAFLKMAFNGKRAMEELAAYDSDLVIGVLGGSAGTTRDCFELLAQSEKSGAKVALFGRKINLAESPLDLVALFRPVLEGAIAPAEAVRSYHASLDKKGLQAKRPLADDLLVTEAVLEGARR
jgi:hypothetical protein